jgi:hypothetical protein
MTTNNDDKKIHVKDSSTFYVNVGVHDLKLGFPSTNNECNLNGAQWC